MSTRDWVYDRFTHEGARCWLGQSVDHHPLDACRRRRCNRHLLRHGRRIVTWSFKLAGCGRHGFERNERFVLAGLVGVVLVLVLGRGRFERCRVKRLAVELLPGALVVARIFVRVGAYGRVRRLVTSRTRDDVEPAMMENPR